jgi:phosphatidate cytidylyltransferase
MTFNVVIVAITTIALWEFYRLSASKNASANVTGGLLWSLTLQSIVSGIVLAQSFYALNWLLAFLAVFAVGVTAILATEMWRNKPNALVNVTMTIAGVAYVTLNLSVLMVLRDIAEPEFMGTISETGGALVLSLFGSVWACDSVAYFVGMAIGKHKIFPRVSPKKSWEGSIAGALGAIAAFWGFSAWWMPNMEITTILVIGSIVGIGGQIGDFAESWLKRDAVIKDSSAILPGHGGVLDRFDSMLFVAPLVWAYIVLRQVLANNVGG